MPVRRRLVLTLAAAGAALAVALPAQAGTPVLKGTVGPGFTITLTANGKAIKAPLKAGRYTLVVNDLATSHDFHLTGPGVDFATDTAGTGRKTVTLTLKPGRYHYQCDPHARFMKGDFTVR